jgi:hypothetical protein
MNPERPFQYLQKPTVFPFKIHFNIIQSVSLAIGPKVFLMTFKVIDVI